MKKIKKIEILNFKAFQKDQSFDVNGKQMAVIWKYLLIPDNEVQNSIEYFIRTS